jgi:hypothetical protein
MARIIRQTLTAALLLLFSSENVALATVFSDESGAVNHRHTLVQQEVHSAFGLLAEENEERDLKDNVMIPLERDVLHPHLFPMVEVNKIADNRLNPPALRSLPIYTFHCTLII